MRTKTQREIANKASKTLRRFADSQTITSKKVGGPKQFAVGLQLGKVIAVVYEVGPGDNRIHRFRKSSRPTLIASSDGKQLAFIGGRYRFTDRGIVDV